jgi:enoyl-CoA hydratase
MADESLVLIDTPIASCAVVTLNRPRAMNALSLALRREIVTTFERLQQDGNTRVVVLTGAGAAFCAGLDLKELGAMANPTAAVVPQPADDPVLAVARFSGPVIGAINGAAITGGFELALACDLLIASTKAVFADTHARVGVLPGWGLSQRLSRLVGIGRAKELAFTGGLLNAERALAWGLVNRVVDDDQLLPHAVALAREMLAMKPEMLTAYKRLIDDGFAKPLGDALELEKERSRAWAERLTTTDVDSKVRS